MHDIQEKRIRVRNRVAYILHACQGKQVLHLGCCDMPFTRERLQRGTLLHAKIHTVAANLFGIDNSSEGITLLRQHGLTNLAVADVEKLHIAHPFPDVNFEVIVAGEILEHLSNPGLFLDGIGVNIKNPTARLIITVPVAHCASRFVYLLLKGCEGVHPDHVSYYSRSTISQLVTRHGYRVDEILFYTTEEHDLRRASGWFFFGIDRMIALVRPALSDGLILSCGRANETGIEPDISGIGSHC